jgi:hypothetical protein
MNAKKNLMALLATILFAGGCKTETVNQDLAGIATASALVVALPLFPIVFPYSAFEQIREMKEDEALYARLDPVYQKRIEMIRARSPKADADEAWNQKATAFLPTIPGGDNYWGLQGTEVNSKNGTENQRQIDSNQFLTSLQALLSDEALQKQVKMPNGRYREFLETCWDYEKAFNLEMYKRIQESGQVSGTKLF